MSLDNESTGRELCGLLSSKGHALSHSTVLRCRTSLGWTCCGSAYCQLIRDVNKEKWLTWAREHLEDDFSDVIFTDETTVYTT